MDIKEPPEPLYRASRRYVPIIFRLWDYNWKGQQILRIDNSLIKLLPIWKPEAFFILSYIFNFQSYCSFIFDLFFISSFAVDLYSLVFVVATIWTKMTYVWTVLIWHVKVKYLIPWHINITSWEWKSSIFCTMKCFWTNSLIRQEVEGIQC